MTRRSVLGSCSTLNDSCPSLTAGRRLDLNSVFLESKPGRMPPIVEAGAGRIFDIQAGSAEEVLEKGDVLELVLVALAVAWMPSGVVDNVCGLVPMSKLSGVETGDALRERRHAKAQLDQRNDQPGPLYLLAYCFTVRSFQICDSSPCATNRVYMVRGAQDAVSEAHCDAGLRR